MSWFLKWQTNLFDCSSKIKLSEKLISSPPPPTKIRITLNNANFDVFNYLKGNYFLREIFDESMTSRENMFSRQNPHSTCFSRFSQLQIGLTSMFPAGRGSFSVFLNRKNPKILNVSRIQSWYFHNFPTFKSSVFNGKCFKIKIIIKSLKLVQLYCSLDIALLFVSEGIN